MKPPLKTEAEFLQREDKGVFMISQIVDERIDKIRKERAELDELRASLERRESEIIQREQEQDENFGTSGERKDALVKEIEELSEELTRLRTERDSSIENFGGEMTKLHAEKTAESAAQVKQLQGEITFLLKGKTELEEEVDRLREQFSGMDEKAKKDLNRIVEEKEAFISRTRDERETRLKELELAHSVATAELEREKKELENDITELEQTKTIEWSKIQAEISRHKTTQLAELDAQREEFLSEFEKEKTELTNSLKAAERKHHSEISAERREWDKEILNYQSEKQKILDDIKMLGYEFEKVKSENILKAEKTRIDEEKILEANRAVAFVKLEEEQAVVAAEYKKLAAEEKIRLREEITALENELNECETKKITIFSDITALELKYEQMRAENEASLQALRIEKMKEIDEFRIAKLQEIESLRQERISALEAVFLQKATALENSRNEKLEEIRESIKKAESELRETKKSKYNTEKEIEFLLTESMKIKEENEALQKAAIVERRLELEKMANDKLAEAEELCKSRIASAYERAKKIEAEGNATEEMLSANIAESTEALLELRRLTTAQKLEFEKEKNEKLEEIEQTTLETMDIYSKMKISKLKEIESELEQYRIERLESIHNDIALRSKSKQETPE
ncbi:MAG: hypothetical protein FWF81_12570 [Defluviitaleaceae bacterium]|nr:hypothetical protein [Defluviitaleaceae bacterium]